MFFYGRGGLPKSYLDALSWYLKAAEQDWPDAQFRLGYMYEKGLGTDKDLQRAVKYYRNAAAHDYPDAENVLGSLYAVGANGVPQDNEEAVMWFKRPPRLRVGCLCAGRQNRRCRKQGRNDPHLGYACRKGAANAHRS